MRLPDWRSRLHAYISASARKRFRPGVHDCGLFAGGAVEAVTGDDPTDWIRGRYTTLRAAQEILSARGYADHVALFAEGREEIATAEARMGDLVTIRNEDGDPVMGVSLGPCAAVLRVSGMAHLPITRAERAFRV